MMRDDAKIDSNRRYALLAFEFCESASSARSVDEASKLILEALKNFGFEYVTCAAVPPPGASPIPGLLLNNRPAEYLAHYESNRYAQKDPVVTELQFTLSPFSWGDVASRRKLTREQRKIIGEASEFGAYEGLVIPIATQSGSLSIFAPCGRQPDLSPHARSAVEIIGMAAHQSLRRLQAGARKPLAQGLTPREREVLHWVAIGKTDDEIGEILHVARWTVVQHVENAKKKLNAYRRTLAIVEALRRGEISL